MGVTLFSLVLLPLCLIWIGWPLRLLQLIVVSSVFEAAAAFTIGDFGVQPALVPSLAFVAYVFLQLLLGASYRGARTALHLTIPFAAVTTWAIVGSYSMPRIFEGRAYVWPQKGGYLNAITALAPNSGNFTQDSYLLMNFALLIFTSMLLSKPRSIYVRSAPHVKIVYAYFVSGFVAAAVAVWQLANNLVGVPYPTDLFYSNPGWAILTGQQVGSVARINGSFAEPSSLGTYMSSVVCATGWLLIQGSRDNVVRVLFAVSLITVALSTSTTAFGALAVVVFALPTYAFLSGSGRLLSSILKFTLPFILILALLSVTVVSFFPVLTDSAMVVVDATLNKRESASYEERTSADADSLQIVLDTFGLGAGWGSNRSSSLLPGLLAGIGVPGVAGLVWFGYSLARHVRHSKRQARFQEDIMVIDACCGAIVGTLVAALIAGPTINSPTFFILTGALIASVARVEKEAYGPGHDLALGQPAADAASVH